MESRRDSVRAAPRAPAHCKGVGRRCRIASATTRCPRALRWPSQAEIVLRRQNPPQIEGRDREAASPPWVGGQYLVEHRNEVVIPLVPGVDLEHEHRHSMEIHRAVREDVQEQLGRGSGLCAVGRVPAEVTHRVLHEPERVLAEEVDTGPALGSGEGQVSRAAHGRQRIAVRGEDLVLLEVVVAVLNDQESQAVGPQPLEAEDLPRCPIRRDRRVQHGEAGAGLDDLCERLVLLDAPAHGMRVPEHDDPGTVEGPLVVAEAQAVDLESRRELVDC